MTAVCNRLHPTDWCCVVFKVLLYCSTTTMTMNKKEKEARLLFFPLGGGGGQTKKKNLWFLWLFFSLKKITGCKKICFIPERRSLPRRRGRRRTTHPPTLSLSAAPSSSRGMISLKKQHRQRSGSSQRVRWGGPSLLPTSCLQKNIITEWFRLCYLSHHLPACACVFMMSFFFSLPTVC